MSQENVEIAGAFYDHFNRAGEPPWEHFEPDAEFDASEVVGLGIFRGRDEVRNTIRNYGAAWEEWTMTPEEFIDAGKYVVVSVRDGGRLRGTRDEVYNLFFHVFTFNSGKISRWQTFTDKQKALGAAGLRE